MSISKHNSKLLNLNWNEILARTPILDPFPGDICVFSEVSGIKSRSTLTVQKHHFSIISRFEKMKILCRPELL